MNTVRLSRRELEKLYKLFNVMNESEDYGSVTLGQTGDNSIGTTLTATFYVTHKDTEGEFTVTITDESDW
jgi:hypothetical protein